MIMITGIAEQQVVEMAKYLRKQLKEKVYGLDDIHTDDTNILIKCYEEEEMKEMFKKHKPNVVINAFGKKKTDFDQYKYHVATTRNIIRFMPKNCKIIYLSTTNVYETGLEPFKETTSLNPHNPFEICKLYGETVAKEKMNHCILRIPNAISLKTVNQSIQKVIEKDLRGIYNIADSINNLVDNLKFKEAIK